MVYGVAWWDDLIWYGLAGMYGLAAMTWYKWWLGGHCIVYGIAGWASHSICFGLARCGMVYVIV